MSRDLGVISSLLARCETTQSASVSVGCAARAPENEFSPKSFAFALRTLRDFGVGLGAVDPEKPIKIK